MATILESMYHTICRELPSYLQGEEYQASEKMRNLNMEKLRKELTPEQIHFVDNLLEENNMMHSIELEAMFQATLAAVVDIIRL